ncbi:hypothetical protein ACSBR2_020091 [Camellia fascicularis]
MWLLGLSKKAILEVVHKHKPCSHLSLDKANASNVTQILSEDQSRVNLIHFRLGSNSAQNNILNSSKATLPITLAPQSTPANLSSSSDSEPPKKTLPLVFDTGSDLTWIQCQPYLSSCYQQEDPIFNPNESTTYKNIKTIHRKISVQDHKIDHRLRHDHHPPTTGGYSALQMAFRQKMTNYPITKGLSLLNTCYNLSNNNSMLIPKISFYLQCNVKVSIYLMGILFRQCIANNQQKTLEMAYDVARGKLGFGTGQCS